jgi:hypothetical protein
MLLKGLPGKERLAAARAGFTINHYGPPRGFLWVAYLGWGRDVDIVINRVRRDERQQSGPLGSDHFLVLRG